MQRKTTNLVALMALSVLALAGGNATAATVEACGDLVCYQWDDSQPALDLFGDPVLVGNDLQFSLGNPSPFRAESVDGTGTGAANATLVIDRVYTVGGQDILSISVTEGGDWEITQGGAVAADLYLQGVSLASVMDIAIDTASVDADGDSGGLQLWETFAEISPSAAFTGPSNNLRLTIQDALAAFTDASGDRAFIEKKVVTVVTSIVPVPPAVLLFGSALGLLGWIRRKTS